MASQPKSEGVQQTNDSPQETTSVESGFRGTIIERYKQIKEHAETYPYVWASYILVYGGFGLWFTYRWRKLRNTEDRVRVLHERLRKLVEEEQSTTNSTIKAAKSGDKVMK